MRGLLIIYAVRFLVRPAILGLGVLAVYLLIAISLNAQDNQPNECALRNRIESYDNWADSAIFMVFVDEAKFVKKAIDGQYPKNTAVRRVLRCIHYLRYRPQRFAIKIFIRFRSLLI